MDETIKCMIDALEKYNAEYIKIKIGKYSIMIATGETSDYIDECMDKEDTADEEIREVLKAVLEEIKSNSYEVDSDVPPYQETVVSYVDIKDIFESKMGEINLDKH